jgi:hypothetical protein
MEYISCSRGGSKLQTTWYQDIICLQSIIHSLSHPWVIIGFVRRVTWRVPLVEQEVLTFTEHLSSPLLCNEVCVAQSLVFCGVFCRSLLFLSFYNICSLPSYCLSLIIDCKHIMSRCHVVCSLLPPWEHDIYSILHVSSCLEVSFFQL